MELVEDRVADEPDGAGVGAEAAERGAGADVEDLDEAGEVGGGEELAVGAEGEGGDDVGEGGDGGAVGGEEGDGGGVGGGEEVGRGRGEGEGRDGEGEVVEGVGGLEGGPVLGFWGLARRGSRLRLQLRLHREGLGRLLGFHLH